MSSGCTATGTSPRLWRVKAGLAAAKTMGEAWANSDSHPDMYQQPLALLVSRVAFSTCLVEALPSCFYVAELFALSQNLLLGIFTWHRYFQYRSDEHVMRAATRRHRVFWAVLPPAESLATVDET
jgi:hypothetical protein